MSLKKGYVRIILFMLFSAVIISAFKTYQSYHIYNSKKINSYYSSAKVLDNQLYNTFNYVENVANSIALDISKLNNTNSPEVSKILLRYKNIVSKNSDLLSWSIFDFVDKNGEVIASTQDGIIKTKIQVLPSKRQWMDLAPKQPWTGHLSNLDYGMVSGEYIIPYGYGFTDKNGNFIGTVSMGINVKKLKTGLIEIINNPEIKFLVYRKDKLNNKLELILANIDEKLVTKKANDKVLRYSSKTGDQRINLIIDKIDFKYLYNDLSSKFIIVVGQDKELLNNELKNYIYPRIEQNIILVIFLLMIYTILKRKVINPILDLSRLSKKIAEGDKEVEIPQYYCEEVDYLARQIKKIKKYIGIEEIKEIAEKENISKTSFLLTVSNQLKNSISALYSIGEIIGNKEGYDSLDEENKRYFLQEIRIQSKEALEFIGDIVDISQTETRNFRLEKLEESDIESLVKRSIKVIYDDTVKSNIQIGLDSEINLPKIRCDQKRIKQVLVNLLHNSIKYSKEHAKILIKIRKLEETDNGTKVSIVIQDNSLGMSAIETSRALNKSVEEFNPQEVDPLNLNLAIIKYLIEQHGGTFTIESEIGRGTKFTICL